MKIMLVITGIACLITLSGCAGMYSAPVIPPNGWVYSDLSAPLSLEPEELSSTAKMGSSKSQCIMGWVAYGDASVRMAAKNGGISDIQQVDYHIKNILGIYSEFTTVVYGK